MPDEVCPLCEGKGSGLPGYFGTMADMFTLLFAFFVLMFSMATMDPNQKPVMYIMNGFFILIFNSFPSGLNLYYTVYNLLNYYQQKLINTPTTNANIK